MNDGRTEARGESRSRGPSFGLSLDCMCGHPQNAHTMTGHCRMPGCPCEHYQPMPEVPVG